MLPNIKSRLLTIFHFFIFWMCCLITQVAFADDTTSTVNATLSAADMLQKFTASIPNLTRLATAIAYVMGMYLVISGVTRMKHMGEMRTQMSHEHSIKGPIILITVGAMLLYFPSTVQVGMNTFWTVPNPYGYTQQQDQWAQFFNACFEVVQLFGVVAFIRGLIILSRLGGHQGGHQDTFAKGLTHIIAGIMCINIYQFVQVIMITLGIQSVIGSG